MGTRQEERATSDDWTALRARLAKLTRQIRAQQRIIEAQQREIEKQRSTQDQLDSIFQSTTQSFLLVDAQGVVQAANATFRDVSERVFGRMPQPGDPILDFVRPVDRDSFHAHFARALDGEVVSVVKHFSVDDTSRWFRFTYTPVGDGARVASVILNSVDVTERKIAERALAMSKERYRSIVHDVLDASAAGLFLLDASFRVVWINEAVERFFGLRREDVLGRHKRRVLREHLAPAMEAPDAFAQRLLSIYDDNSSAETFECRVRAGDGREARHLEHQSCPIYTGWYAGGRIEHYYDVTALKHAEHDLRGAKQKAEAASAAKSRFLATVSHEIRSPMSGILGFADLLEDCALDGESRRFVEIIRESGEGLLALLNDVLDLARLEADAVPLEQRPFSLRECLDAALRTVRPAAEQSGVALRVDVDSDLPGTVAGDARRLRQVLVNLLGNAVKFTRAGHVRLRAARASTPWPPPSTPPATSASAPASTSSDAPSLPPGTPLAVHVSVSDTGIGIDPAHLDAIFEPFHQVDASTTRTYGGTGLGLSIVARLVDVMGGGVWAESEPGAGSTFHVCVPVQAATASQPTGAVPSDDPAAPAPLAAPTRVLVVDDDPTHRDLLCRYLTGPAYAVEAVASGADALERLTQAVGPPAAFDVVLMDVCMPDADGLETTRALRQRSVPQPTVVGVTAQSLPEDKARCLDAGMDAYLAKPVTRADLVATIRCAQRERSGLDGVAAP